MEKLTNDLHRKVSGWESVCCATTGASHIQEGIVCQDKTCTLEQNGVRAFALADGAGSARLSHFGAQTVTERICRLLCGSFDRLYTMTVPAQAKELILGELLAALKETADTHGCRLGDLASTLLAAAVCGDRYILMHIGDGVIGYVKDDEIRVASAPSNGEFANTTTFVTSEGAMRDMRIRKGASGAVQGFVLMSDGSEASLFSKQKMCLAPVLKRLVQRLSMTSAEFLRPSLQKSLDEVVSRKTRDDCSLVLAARMERTYVPLSRERQEVLFDRPDDAMTGEEWELQRSLFARLLDSLEREMELQELCERLEQEDSERLYRDGILPLLDMGYITKSKDGKYRRAICCGSAQEEPDENRGMQDA